MANPVIDLFFQYFPWSLGIFIVPLVLVWWRTRERGGSIENWVLVFFKGGTYGFYPGTMGSDEVSWDIDGVEYTEGITVHPRIGAMGKNDKTLRRTWLYSEGIGMVDIPPLTRESKIKIIDYLKEKKIVSKTSKLGKKDPDEWSEQELMTYIKYYQFDIEQILDKPMEMARKKTGLAIGSSVDRIRRRNQEDRGDKVSNMYKLGLIVVGILIGGGFFWAFSLKGYI